MHSRKQIQPVTREEWLSSINSVEMVESCRSSTTERKLRLFAAACFRRLEHLLPDERLRSAINAVEDYAHEIPRSVANHCRAAFPDSSHSFDRSHEGQDDPYFVALMLYRELVSSLTGHHAAYAARGLANHTVESAEQCKLLRCIVGIPPFEDKDISVPWRSGEVVKLAQSIYNTNSFELLPRLASELERTGCDDVEMLMHCRTTEPHVHGCWVIDTLLTAR